MLSYFTLPSTSCPKVFLARNCESYSVKCETLNHPFDFSVTLEVSKTMNFVTRIIFIFFRLKNFWELQCKANKTIFKLELSMFRNALFTHFNVCRTKCVRNVQILLSSLKQIRHVRMNGIIYLHCFPGCKQLTPKTLVFASIELL